MERQGTFEEYKEILNDITEDKSLKKFVYNHIWVSGSNTEVAPYTLWSHTIDVQLAIKRKGTYPNYKFYAKDESELKRIAREIQERNPLIGDFYLRTNDGSCPPELVFELK